MVNTFLEEHQVVRKEWLANSRDLSPIEDLWDVLGRAVRWNHPPPVNRQHLLQILDKEWAAIPQATIIRLFDIAKLTFKTEDAIHLTDELLNFVCVFLCDFQNEIFLYLNSNIRKISSYQNN